jgi:hypothetical protein
MVLSQVSNFANNAGEYLHMSLKFDQGLKDSSGGGEDSSTRTVSHFDRWQPSIECERRCAIYTSKRAVEFVYVNRLTALMASNFQVALCFTQDFAIEILSPYDFLLTANTARRYLRLFKWIDNFNAASRAFTSSKPSTPKMLETAKFTFLAIYFFMEFISITEVMGLTNHSAGPWLIVESSRMWFTGLVFSILQTLWESMFAVGDDKQQQLVADKAKKSSARSEKKAVVASGPKSKGFPLKQLVIDGLDLLIPGVVIQVFPFSQLVIGIAMTISTVLQLTDMWSHVQMASKPSQKK